MKIKPILICIYIFLALASINAKPPHKYQTKIDSLIRYSNTLKNDTNKVKILYEIARSYVPSDFLADEYYSDFEQYLEIAYNLSKKLDYQLGKFNYHRTKASFLWNIGKLTDAINGFESALLIINKNDSLSIARINYQLGVLYSETSNFNQSLECHFKALKIYESMNHSLGIGSSLSDIGSLYLMMKNDEKGEEYLKKAIEVNEKNKDTFYLRLNFSNMGNLKDSKGDYKEGLKYKLKSLNYFKINFFTMDHIISYINIGNSYLRLNDYKNAEKYYIMVLDSSENYSCDLCKALGLTRYSNLINTQIKNKLADKSYNLDSIDKTQVNLSIQFLMEGIELFTKDDKTSEVISSILLLSEAYEIKGDFKNAYEQFKNAVTLQDSITSVDVKTQIANLESKRELEIKEKENLILNKDKELLIKDNELINATLIQNKQHLTLAEKEKQLQRLAFLKEQAEKQEKEKQLNLSETQMKLQQSQIETLDKDKERQNAELKAKNLQRNFLIAGAVVFIILFIIAFIRFREKKKLSEKLALQNAEIEKQKNLVETQKQYLEEKNHQIISSISYAATIQNAILPWESSITSSFEDSFILFKPKDIVSGDSYWFKEIDKSKYLAVIDCTGHGVPGSMLTVIANSVLDEAVLTKKLNETSEILTYMNNKVTDILNQKMPNSTIRDGMEVALIKIENEFIEFSGAGRPLFVRNGTMETYKTDKRGIAGSSSDENYNFKSTKIEKSSDLRIYLSSDGFADQMNENSKKYSTKRFLETLDRISEFPLDKQKEVLENEFNSHKGNREQIDDVTVIGIRI